jgi:hypothetical protein
MKNKQKRFSFQVKRIEEGVLKLEIKETILKLYTGTDVKDDDAMRHSK